MGISVPPPCQRPHGAVGQLTPCLSGALSAPAVMSASMLAQFMKTGSLRTNRRRRQKSPNLAFFTLYLFVFPCGLTL